MKFKELLESKYNENIVDIVSTLININIKDKSKKIEVKIPEDIYHKLDTYLKNDYKKFKESLKKKKYKNGLKFKDINIKMDIDLPSIIEFED